jgi:hypothetical protein
MNPPAPATTTQRDLRGDESVHGDLRHLGLDDGHKSHRNIFVGNCLDDMRCLLGCPCLGRPHQDHVWVAHVLENAAQGDELWRVTQTDVRADSHATALFQCRLDP